MKKFEDCGATCQSCRYWKRFEGSKMEYDGECYAYPPRGQFITDSDGDLTIMFYRPQTEESDAACSLWGAKN